MKPPGGKTNDPYTYYYGEAVNADIGYTHTTIVGAAASSSSDRYNWYSAVNSNQGVQFMPNRAFGLCLYDVDNAVGSFCGMSNTAYIPFSQNGGIWTQFISEYTKLMSATPSIYDTTPHLYRLIHYVDIKGQPYAAQYVPNLGFADYVQFHHRRTCAVMLTDRQNQVAGYGIVVWSSDTLNNETGCCLNLIYYVVLGATKQNWDAVTAQLSAGQRNLKSFTYHFEFL